MSGAFDWPPGGCCCEVSGYFDVWSNTVQPQPGDRRLVRYSSLREDAAVIKSDDPNSIDWFIEPEDATDLRQYLQTATGFPAFGNRVWVTKLYNVEQSAVGHLALYDTVTKQELFDAPNQALPRMTTYADDGPGFGTGGPHAGKGATSQTMVANWDTQFLTTVNDQGQVLRVAAGPGTAASGIVRCLAWRNWPDGAGVLTGRVMRGAISVASGQLIIANPQFVTPFGFDLMMYDSSPTHWAAVVKNVSTNVYSLIIDGVTVKTLNATYSGVTPGFGPFGEPHACHPHETLGDGWVGVPMLRTSGNALVDPAHPWYIQFYKDGAPSWSIVAPWPHLSAPPRIDHSGDRWIYINDLSNANGAGGISPTVFHSIPNRWKHDGSQSWRSGVLNGNTTIPDGRMPFAQIEIGYWGGTSTLAVVQNSAAIENALPLDFPPS